jgi:branched-subunit amino acid ABC-type transport system permease component
MSRRAAPLLIALSLAVAFLATASSVLAHPKTSTMTTVAAAVVGAEGTTLEWRAAAIAGHLASVVVWLVAALVALGAVRGLRNALALATLLAVIVLTFESGIHSVHHLGDDHGASQCVVASASTHLAGTPAEPPSCDVVSVLNVDRPPVIAQSIAASQPFRPDSGRAPPG